ncbi:MAG: VWA domain-containing protein [Vicinamibacteria bacterium]
MKRPIAVLLLALPAVTIAEEPQETPKFPTQVEQVIVDAVVTDKKGTPITGLTAADFTVLEDGTPQTVVSFEAVQLPTTPAVVAPPKPRVSSNVDPALRVGRTFVVVFDDIHMTRFNAIPAKKAIAEFLKNGVREGDRVTLVSTGGTAWWSARMEEGRDELITLLKRLEGRHIPDSGQDRISDYEAMRIWVYNDPDVTARVSRRYQNLGISGTQGQNQQSQSQSPGGSDSIGDPMVRGKASEVYFQAVAKNRITLDLMERVLGSLAQAKGRKAVILVSDGFIYDPNLDEFKTVVQASRRANAAIYSVQSGGLSGMSEFMTAEFPNALADQDVGAALLDNSLAADGSDSLASDTGGFVVRNTNDLTRGIQRIALESQTYYLLGYTPTNTKQDGRFRKIEVRLARKGIDVRARKGYYAPVEGKAPTKKPTPGIDPQVQQALDSPYEMGDIPLRMSAYVMDETVLGKANTMVVVEADIKNVGFQEIEGRLVDSLEFLLVTAHRESGEYFREDQKVEMKLRPATREKLLKTWFPVPTKEFELAPGGYQAKIVVRDKNTGRIGTVTHDFDVPDLAQFRTSSINLSDMLQQGPDGKQVPQLPMLARRTFETGVDAKLFGQFSVFGAAKDKESGMPKVTAGYQIRGGDGTVRGEVPPSLIKPTSLGKLLRMVGTKLDDFPPGDYEFVLDLKDEVAGKTLEVREPFTLVAPSSAPSASR